MKSTDHCHQRIVFHCAAIDVIAILANILLHGDVMWAFLNPSDKSKTCPYFMSHGEDQLFVSILADKKEPIGHSVKRQKCIRLDLR